MRNKIYDSNDKNLIKSMMAAGLSEYKAQKLICFANENKISLQNAYWLTGAGVIRADIIMGSILLLFAVSIAQGDLSELWVFF